MGSAPDCGANSPDVFARYDPDGRSWKTCLPYSPGAGPDTAFRENWPRSGTVVGLYAYRRPYLEPPTCAGAVSLWPTIRASDAERGERGDVIQAVRGNPNSHYKMPTLTVHGNNNRKGVSANSGDGLRTAIVRERLPTLTASDGERGVGNLETIHERGFSPTLRDVVGAEEKQRYPTLLARDSKSGRSRKRYGNSRPLNEQLLPTLTATRWSGLQSHGANAMLGPLSPEWCEWYMGFPIGWTELESSATP